MVNPSSTRNKLQVIGLDLSNGRAVASELLRYSYRFDYPTVLDREARLLEFRTRLETLQLFDTGEPPPPLPIADINYLNGVAFRDRMVRQPAQGAEGSSEKLEALRRRLSDRYREQLDKDRQAVGEMIEKQRGRVDK